ncbi:MAG: hypothetical protein NUV57_02875 [archaeon]|nr:hypothetical protein [archaeon]
MPILFEGALKKWKFTLAFTAITLLFALLEIFYQLTLPLTTQSYAIVRGLGFAGATFLAMALLLPSLFRFRPKLAKYWTITRALGVGGFLLICVHVAFAILVVYLGDLRFVFYSLNPMQNPLIFGVLGFLFFLPVALTSTDWAVRKFASGWKKIQRLVYLGFWASIFHFLMVNPLALNNVSGYLLELVTVAALLGELYWFFRVSGQRKFRSIGFAIGVFIIILYLVTIYLGYFGTK